jgi:hypothetical protein
MPTSVLISLSYLCCGECGCVFCAPEELVRVKGGEGLHCPSGHLTQYHTDDAEAAEDSEKVTELRRELVHAIHRMEQAEARASENQRPAPVRRRKSNAAGETT